MPAFDLTALELKLEDQQNMAPSTEPFPHAPSTPSPLNPKTNDPSHRAAATVRKRRNSNSARSSLNLSLTQRFLRYKAAEAWRTITLLHEAAQYETAMMQAIAERHTSQVKTVTVKSARRDTTDSSSQLQSLRHGVETGAMRRSDGEFRTIQQADADQSTEIQAQPERKQYIVVNLRDANLITPRRVALAMGLMRRVPAVRTNGWLRCVQATAAL